jgi:hypothetical protein
LNDLKIRLLLLAVWNGRILGAHSAHEIGVTPCSFWRWVAGAQARGVVFKKNPRGGRKRGAVTEPPRPWAIVKWGEFRDVKKEAVSG